MLHLVFCLRRSSHLTREEFQRYWRETHAPLVQRHAAALGVHRYVQAHTVAHPVADAAQAGRGAPEPYDGVAELWFDGDALAACDANARGARSQPCVARRRATLHRSREVADLLLRGQ